MQQLRWCSRGQEGGDGHMQDPKEQDIRKRGENPNHLTNPQKSSKKRQQCLDIVKYIQSEGYCSAVSAKSVWAQISHLENECNTAMVKFDLGIAFTW